MLNIGDTLYLDIEDEKEEKQSFKCRLVDKVQEYFFIDFPINIQTKKVGFFHDGTQFAASFIGKDQAVYSFQTQLVGRKKGRIPMLIIRDPGRDKYIRIQRRQHVRVDASVDVAVHPTDTEFTPFVSVTADISGGGLALVLPRNHSIPVGRDILCWLSLPLQTGEIKYVQALCHVIRIIPTKDSPREKASIQFTKINENDRQTIIRFVFERQLYLRKKGITE